MRKEYPVKRKGESLEASHVNKLSASSEKFERLVPGSFQGMRHTDSTISFSGPEPFHIYGATVSGKQADPSDEEDSGLYLVKLRWYSFERAMWVANSDKEWTLDTRMDGDHVGLEIGERVRVYWDPQRGAFVLSSPGFYLRLCDLTADLLPGSTAAANLRIGRTLAGAGGAITVTDLAEAITSGKKIANGTGCWVFRDSRMNLDLEVDEYVYLIPLDCEVDQ